MEVTAYIPAKAKGRSTTLSHTRRAREGPIGRALHTFVAR